MSRAAASDRWNDLPRRLISALAMLAVGGGAIWWGGLVFAEVAVLVTGLMIWELARMTAPDRPGDARALGLLAGLVLGVVLWLHAPFALALLIVPPVLGLLRPRRDPAVFLVYALAVMLAGYGLVALRAGHGLGAITWIVAVVVVSDILGYFAGRMLGGPRFWPRVSPKKTWSGTVAGWIGAALVGLAFVQAGGGWGLVWLSPFIAFAGQMGDIAESAIKRRAGVKDSSSLIPGHGGVLDRFDALLGAVLLVLAIAQVMPLPLTEG
ncbi:phosphatidate cytidylyltransferase [Pontitalea aquivivens]|uniref:phosphatidate cytidylyltransferase n=1 Tax=Pontitalea aquivivens TaxID=3388663 RepID=UPI003970F94C